MCRLYFSQVKVIVLPGVFGYSVIHIYSGNDSGKAGELSTSDCPSVNHEKIKRNKDITMFSGKKRESPKRRKTKEELLEELDMLRKEFEC